MRGYYYASSPWRRIVKAPSAWSTLFSELFIVLLYVKKLLKNTGGQEKAKKKNIKQKEKKKEYTRKPNQKQNWNIVIPYY